MLFMSLFDRTTDHLKEELDTQSKNWILYLKHLTFQNNLTSSILFLKRHIKMYSKISKKYTQMTEFCGAGWRTRTSFHSHRVLRICCCAETDHQSLWDLGKYRSICYLLQVRTWTGDGFSHLVAKNVLVSTATFSQRPGNCGYLLSHALTLPSVQSSAF